MSLISFQHSFSALQTFRGCRFPRGDVDGRSPRQLPFDRRQLGPAGRRQTGDATSQIDNLEERKDPGAASRTAESSPRSGSRR